MRKISQELRDSVDAVFAEKSDSQVERDIEVFSNPKFLHKRADKEARDNAWNSFVRLIRERRGIVRDSGILTKGARNKLAESLDEASYKWPDRESGLVLPVVDICITGFQAYKFNDLGSPFSRLQMVSGVASDVRGVECEVIALPNHDDPGIVSDLGIGIISTQTEDPKAFSGDEEYIFVPADRLITIPTAKLRNTSTR